MEKQPIDDLFNRKLHNAEIAPGSAAWNTLQHKLGNRRVVPIWTYVAFAASLLIVGAFGWWVLVASTDIGANKMMATITTPAQKLKPSDETPQLVGYGKGEEVPNSENAPSLFVQEGQQKIALHRLAEKHASKIVQRSREGENEMRKVNTVVPSFNPAQQNEKVDIAQISLQPKVLESTLSKSTSKDLANVKTPTTTERTLIVSIEAPAAVTPQPIQPITLSANSTPKSGLGSLFDKVKKIKDGETFALSTTKTAKSGRRGLGKFYDEVKESIQNNAADE